MVVVVVVVVVAVDVAAALISDVLLFFSDPKDSMFVVEFLNTPCVCDITVNDEPLSGGCGGIDTLSFRLFVC